MDSIIYDGTLQQSRSNFRACGSFHCTRLIIQAICHHHLNFNTLNQYLLDFNKELFDTFCQNVISNYEMYAGPKIKSYGI